MRKTILIAIFTTSLVFSCKHDPIDEPIIPADNGTNPVTSEACDPNLVYFQNDILPLLQSNCAYAGCHGAGSSSGGVDLTSYNSIISTADVKANNADGSELYKVIVDTDLNDRMPPPPNNALSSSDIQKIRDWINQGALNNSCNACDTTKFTFALTINPIIEKYCKGCHSGTAPSGGILLSNYTEVKQQVTSGRLLGSIKHQAGFSQMPKSQPKLSECIITQFEKWIDNGANND